LRLFIAINFDPATKDKLLDVQRRLRASATGNFTRPENLHLTVAFLGEVGETAAVKRAVSDRFVQPVELEFDRVGTFRRDLYWVGVKPGPAMDDLYRGLVEDLRRAGFSGDWPDRLVPHITLAREVSLHAQPDLAFEPFSRPARRLSLMKSERVAGALTYTEVFGKSV
jgi:2'-5' RNA ligase